MRVIDRKRPPLMTPQRWAMVVVAIILLTGTLLYMYYRSIQAPMWTAEQEARQLAVDAANLQEVTEIHKHVWDSVSWIVRGVDESGRDVFVWMNREGEPYVSDAGQAYSTDRLSGQLLASKPNAVIKHIRPGLFNGSPCWEIYYKYTDTSEHYYYDFYNFESGELIVTYKLPAKTEP